jgi:hypothetical protein
MRKSDDKVTSTRGRRFYDEQIKLLQEARTDELIDRHYHNTAVLVSTTSAISGRESLKHHFRAFVAMLGTLTIVSLDGFIETEDSILFETTIRTALGEAKVYDAFVLRNGKATHHFTGLSSQTARG